MKIDLVLNMKILVVFHEHQHHAWMVAAFLESLLPKAAIYLAGIQVSNNMPENLKKVLYESFLENTSVTPKKIGDLINTSFDLSIIFLKKDLTAGLIDLSITTKTHISIPIRLPAHFEDSFISTEDWRKARDIGKEHAFSIYQFIQKIKPDHNEHHDPVSNEM